MVKFVPLMITFIVFGIFVFGFLSFAFLFAQQNNAPLSLTNDPSINPYYSSISGNLTASATESDKANAAFSNSSITTTSSLPYINSVGGIWKTIKNTPIAIYNLTIGLVVQLLLGSSAGLVVTAALSTILMLLIISAVVFWVTRGEGG